MKKIQYNGESKLLSGIATKINWLIDQVGQKIDASEKGVANGVATLDGGGKVPSSQLPSYVDDVIEGYYYNDNFYEDSAHTELITPETSKIYVDLPTNKSYRWGGSEYVEISSGADEKVKQIPYTTSDTNARELLLSKSTDGLEHTEEAYKSDALKFKYGSGFSQFYIGDYDSQDGYYKSHVYCKWIDCYSISATEIGGLWGIALGNQQNNGILRIQNTNGHGVNVYAPTDLTEGEDVRLPSSSGQLALKSEIPTSLSQLTDDSTHRLVTDTEKSTWSDNRAVAEIRLTNEDLNNVTTVGFYFAAGGNTVTNKPTGYNNFGLVVIHNASGSRYTQIISNENGSYRRIKKADGTWTSWVEDKFTDEKVKQEAVSTGAYYVLFGKTNTLDTETASVQKNGGLKYYPASANLLLVRQHTATTAATTRLEIGNNIAVGTAGNVYATLRLYGRGEYKVDITDSDNVLTADRVLKLPNIDGTIATNSDAVMWTQQNVLGAKNLITFPYYHGFNRTSNNVVFTVDDDGTITVGGTQASANASFYLMYNVKLPNGTYTLSDGGVGTTDTYLSCVYYTTPSASAQYYDVANNGSVTFTVNNWDRAIIRIWSRNGKTADNLVFKPMLRLSTIADSTFEPYAETNRQLTVTKLDISEIASVENSNTASQAYAVGDYMIWRGGFYRVVSAISSGGVITLNTNVTKTTLGAELKRALT